MVAGPVGGWAPHEKPLARHAVFGPVVGIVVVDLVIVPGEDPRESEVRALQVGVALVEGITRAVLVERIGLARVVLAHVLASPGRFVDVVAEKSYKVEIVAGHVAVGAEPALLVLLARSEGEAQPRHLRSSGRSGTRAPRLARRIACDKAVPVPAVRFEAAHLDVHRVGPRRFRSSFS